MAGAGGFWAVFYVLYAPYLARSIKLREPPGDAWRAAAFVAYGALPLTFYLPFWYTLTAWPISIAAYPLVVMWSSRRARLGRLPDAESELGAPPRILMGLAGAIFAIAAGLGRANRPEDFGGEAIGAEPPAT